MWVSWSVDVHTRVLARLRDNKPTGAPTNGAGHERHVVASKQEQLQSEMQLWLQIKKEEKRVMWAGPSAVKGGWTWPLEMPLPCLSPGLHHGSGGRMFF